MTTLCGSQHPDLPLACQKSVDPGRPHTRHVAYPPGGEAVEWAEDDGVARPARAADPQRLLDARAAYAEANPPLSDPTAAGASVGAHDRPTQVMAAELVTPRSGTQRWRVLMAFREAHPAGMTDYEVSEATEIWAYSVVPRRGELTRGGWLDDSGETRASGRGGQQVVWVLSRAAQGELGLLAPAPAMDLG